MILLNEALSEGSETRGRDQVCDVGRELSDIRFDGDGASCEGSVWS